MAKPLAPFSSYPVSGGKVYDQNGSLMGDMDDYLPGVNDPARVQDLRKSANEAARAKGKQEPFSKDRKGKLS